jgi:hypothetical protein
MAKAHLTLEDDIMKDLMLETGRTADCNIKCRSC